MAIWAIWAKRGVQKGVSLLDLHYPQVASNGFHRVSYGDPLFSPFGHFRRTRYGTSHGYTGHMGPYAPNRGPKGCLTFGPPCTPRRHQMDFTGCHMETLFLALCADMMPLDIH